MSNSKQESLFTRTELEELIRDQNVTVDMSARRTIEDGEVKIEALCTCTPEEQVLTTHLDDEVACRCGGCKRPIPHLED